MTAETHFKKYLVNKEKTFKYDFFWRRNSKKNCKAQNNFCWGWCVIVQTIFLMDEFFSIEVIYW